MSASFLTLVMRQKSILSQPLDGDPLAWGLRQQRMQQRHQPLGVTFVVGVVDRIVGDHLEQLWRVVRNVGALMVHPHVQAASDSPDVGGAARVASPLECPAHLRREEG